MATSSNPQMPYIQIAALGRPFKLGMLYNYCTEALIEKSPFWDRDVLKGCEYQVSKHSKVPGVIKKDTLESKANVLDLSAHLRLSFLSDLFKPFGASLYFDDRISSCQQDLITVFVKQSTVFCGLKMKQLEVTSIYPPETLIASGATHVVTGIMYGGLALFVFDQHRTKIPSHQQCGFLDVLIQKLLESERNGRVCLTQEQREHADSLQIRFYSDFVKCQKHMNFSEAVEIYKSLPEYFGRNGENAVPVLVWLYPLSKLDDRAPVLATEIGINLVLAVEHCFEFLHHVDITCIAMMENKACQNFSGLYGEIKRFTQMLRDFKGQFQAQLFCVVPNIRAGKLASTELSFMLKRIEQSPFSERTINKWLQEKQRQIYSDPHLFQSENDHFLQKMEIYLLEMKGKSHDRSELKETRLTPNQHPIFGWNRDYNVNISKNWQQEHVLHMNENEGTIYQNIEFHNKTEINPTEPFSTDILNETTKGYRPNLPEWQKKRPPRVGFSGRKGQEPLQTGAATSANVSTQGSEFQSQMYNDNARNIPYIGTYVKMNTNNLPEDERQHSQSKTFIQDNANPFHCAMMPGENLLQFVPAVPSELPPYLNLQLGAVSPRVEHKHYLEVHPTIPHRTAYHPEFLQHLPLGETVREQSSQLQIGDKFTFQPCGKITSYKHTGLTSDHYQYEVPLSSNHIKSCSGHIYETPEKQGYVLSGEQPQKHGQYFTRRMPIFYHQHCMAQAPFQPTNTCTVYPYQKDVSSNETPYCTCSRCDEQWYHFKKDVCSCKMQRHLCQHAKISLEEEKKTSKTKNDEIQLKEKEKKGKTMTLAMPNKPRPSNITHKSITLSWEKPGSQNEIISYDLSWKEVDGVNQTTLNIKASDTSYTISTLKPGQKYKFRIRAYSEDGPSEYSESTEPVQTRPTSPPGKPEVKKVASKTKLEWRAPLSIGEKILIESYIIFYSTGNDSGDSEDDEEQWLEFKTVPGKKNSTDIKVPANIPHRFKIVAKCSGYGESEASEESEPFCHKISGPELLRSKVQAEVQMLHQGTPSIYKVLGRDTMSLANEKIRKCELGPAPINRVTDKVIMIVGATGSGKSTLINGLVNYILGVEWMDDFRVKLIVESTADNQSDSQTSWITSYTIHHQSSYSVPFTLTIIDTPGFGDTAGIKRDKQITDQITKFFTTRGQGGIDNLDAVGFVVQASLARLTPTQRYIFDSILALFGKDITGNIFMLITFADGQNPPVLHGLHEANLPYEKYFKFNNSALFATNEENNDEKDEGNFAELFWNMGKKSFQLFLEAICKVEAKTLLLTKEVLNERNHLEAYIQGIQIDIQLGLNKLEQLEKEKQILKIHQADINKNKDFEYEVEEETVELTPLPPNTYTLNCLTCKRTCQYPVMCDENYYIKKCSSMKGGSCTVCPGNCDWRIHKLLPHMYNIKRVKTKKTAAELKRRYCEAQEKKLSAEKNIQKIQEEYEAIQERVLQQTEKVRETLKRLYEIELKPNPLSTTDYIDILIDSEQGEASPGWKQRVDQLTKVRQQAEWINKAVDKEFDPFMQYKQKSKNKLNWRSSWLSNS